MRHVLAARSSGLITRQEATIRHHISHAGSQTGDGGVLAAAAEAGPREALRLGLDSARASQNVLRLLESSHGSFSRCADASSAAWHPSGVRWTRDGSADWARSTHEEQGAPSAPSPTSGAGSVPRLAWLNFSDDRTALAKLVGGDGLRRYVSLLRLDPDAKARGGATQSIPSNDGWCIVREVLQGADDGDRPSVESVVPALRNYLSIEHGGGATDAARARELFAPGASLVSVGTAPPEERRTDWSAPTGSLLEISLDAYLRGVEDQSPHPDEARAHDRITQLDLMPSAAAATVHVGNGARTALFVDHLLLGHHEGRWQILSKTFSPRAYPS